MIKGRAGTEMWSAMGLSTWLVLVSCGGAGQSERRPTTTPETSRATEGPRPDDPGGSPSFAEDVAFLEQHGEVVVLADPQTGAAVAVSPTYQGRVMTSTSRAQDGPSFGYIHRAVIAAGTRDPHMNVFGGEDRFWLGPEGGQYALYFPPGAPFEFASWHVPEPFDWGAWPVAERGPNEVRFLQTMVLTNYAGTQLSIGVDRRVRLLGHDAAYGYLGMQPDANVAMVAYESVNTIENRGQEPWTPDRGLVSVWILGMYRPSPQTTVAIPFVPGPEQKLGPIVRDDYFGKVPADRLKVGERAVFFRADGKQRGKIGIPHPRAMPAAGSYDPSTDTLTLVQYNLPGDPPSGTLPYVNSMWKHQDEPYGGDVVNSYCDGPPEPGAPPLGPFYELETSSPAAALAPGDTLTHIHRTFHLVGPATALDPIARAVLRVSIADIDNAL